MKRDVSLIVCVRVCLCTLCVRSETKIVSKAQGDANRLKDELGKTRNLGFGDRSLPPDFAFGSTQKRREWGVAECLIGMPQDVSSLAAEVAIDFPCESSHSSRQYVDDHCSRLMMLERGRISLRLVKAVKCLQSPESVSKMNCVF